MKLKHSLLIAALLAPLSLAAHADGGSTILGGAIGGGAGAAVGHAVGGRDGAIVGGALGGAVGAKIGSDYRERRVGYERAYPVHDMEYGRGWHDRGRDYGWRHDGWRHDGWRHDGWRHDGWRRDEWHHDHHRYWD